MSTARRATLYSAGDPPRKPPQSAAAAAAAANAAAPSSLATLAQSPESESDGNAARPHWLGAQSESLLSIGRESKDRLASIDADADFDFDFEKKTRIKWDAIRASQDAQKNAEKRVKEKLASGVGGLKRWHNKVLAVDNASSSQLHHRKISGASSEYDHQQSDSSINGSSASSDEYDTDHRRSNTSEDDNDTAISSQYSSTGSTQNDSATESDSSNSNGDSIGGGSPMYSTAPENLPKESNWGVSLRKGDSSMPSDLATASETFIQS
ncbi:hypothetical protein BDR26DRAFT_892559 [Obelidium mucronatum]|nr:hypothetical protein BDR26DRAFT_892559 [Obelidium mucronatum]